MLERSELHGSSTMKETTTKAWVLLVVPLGSALAAAWVGLLGSFFAHQAYIEYFHPMVDRLQRSGDFALVRNTDSTYYYRTCSSQDMSVWEDQAEELIFDKEQGSADSSYYTDHMLKHGVGVVPDLLQPETAAALREYIVQRNKALSDADAIYIHPNYMRQAFALDPAEDTTVQAAMHELASHSILKAVVAGVTGDDDPAVTEVAVLTSHHGAESQDWHHDVIVERGSAVQFARTFLHSYTLFIALQDTTAEMGATKVCPGTHMCAASQVAMCGEHGFQPLLFQDYKNETPVWRRGDGVIFNQQLGHRGEEHTDPNAESRVMLVVSFSSRPRLGTDSRVLASGLYCFTLWKNWGLTWQDLYWNNYTGNPQYRALKTLGVWKLSAHNWGLDFLTKSVMEWNLGENGMSPADLREHVDYLRDVVGIPKFLHGRLIDLEEEETDEDVYHAYIESTLENFWDFFVKVNAGLSTLCLTIYGLMSCVVQRKRPPTRPVTRIILSVYVVPSLLLAWHLHTVKDSEWGRNIHNGLTFRAPFPKLNERVWAGDYDEVGPTTLPERTDVLIGTRYESLYLGSMKRWLDFHPGNQAYAEAVNQLSRYYRDYRGLPTAFQNSLVSHVTDLIRGRMLKQDWQDGSWMVLERTIQERRIHRSLEQASSKVLEDLESTANRLLAYYRYEVSYRESALAIEAQLYLVQLKTKLLSRRRGDKLAQKRKKSILRSAASLHNAPSSVLLFKPRLSAVTQNSTGLSARHVPATAHSPRWIAFPENTLFHIGDTVLALEHEETWSRASILGIRGNEYYGEVLYNIAYESGYDEDGAPASELMHLRPLESGHVIHCERGKSEITNIKPDGLINVEYEMDGSWEEDVDPSVSCG